ncbi:MAG: hypothetical protein AAFX08_08280 [Pseudomonadota bacterium]
MSEQGGHVSQPTGYPSPPAPGRLVGEAVLSGAFSSEMSIEPSDGCAKKRLASLASPGVIGEAGRRPAAVFGPYN